ncbi:MAG: hypothetical protein NVV82_22665 [Sporocytophaga sp.]|nr:hypothetical protein [Sporocytophaga sp.]
MKKHLLTLIFGICSTMLAFTACKKDNDAEPSGSKTVTCLPDTIDFHDKGKLVLEYDSQSQLIKVNKTDKDGKYDGYITFIHTLNKLKELEYNANGKKTFRM